MDTKNKETTKVDFPGVEVQENLTSSLAIQDGVAVNAESTLKEEIAKIIIDMEKETETETAKKRGDNQGVYIKQGKADIKEIRGQINAESFNFITSQHHNTEELKIKELLKVKDSIIKDLQDENRLLRLKLKQYEQESQFFKDGITAFAQNFSDFTNNIRSFGKSNNDLEDKSKQAKAIGLGSQLYEITTSHSSHSFQGNLLGNKRETAYDKTMAESSQQAGNDSDEELIGRSSVRPVEVLNGKQKLSSGSSPKTAFSRFE